MRVGLVLFNIVGSVVKFVVMMDGDGVDWVMMCFIGGVEGGDFVVLLDFNLCENMDIGCVFEGVGEKCGVFFEARDGCCD